MMWNIEQQSYLYLKSIIKGTACYSYTALMLHF
jgi:hypothetical protein